MTISAYPLSWPFGWKRTATGMRKSAKFSRGERQYSTTGGSWLAKRAVTISDGTTRVLAELTRMGVSRDDVVISTSVELRLDGLPYSNKRAPQDPGVAVYWRHRKADKVMAIDLYDTVADNLAAVAATLEAMRAIERHGGAAILDRAFTGFAALPSPEQAKAPSWRDVLGLWDADLRPLANVTLEQAEQAYRRMRSATHPDKHGGDATSFDLVQRAIEQARQELGA